MKNELIITATDIAHISASENALKAYDFLQNNLPDEGATEEEVQNFISSRNAKIASIRDLWELKSWFEKSAEAIKDICKHSFNLGSIEDMPREAKWKSGGTIKEFAEGAGAIVASALVSRHLVTKEQLLNTLSVANVCKAAGIKADKLMDMFPDTVIEREKAASLTII